TLLTIPISTLLKFLPQWTNGSFPDYPFLDRMTITFVFIIGVMVTMSLLRPHTKSSHEHIEIDFHHFKVTPGFMAGSIIILGILTGLYASFW
ncbi:MAG TPA: sodium transporter, partial [Chryseosolibacter sp.]